MSRIYNYLFFVAGALAVNMAEASPLGQSTTPVGAAFASASAGSQIFSGLGAPGDAIHGGVTDTYVNSQYNTSSVGGTATATASNSGSSNGHPFSNSATGSASLGSIKVQASNDGSTAVPFPGGAANAGWNDQFTITGGTGSGVWVVPIVVNGTMNVTGLNGGGQVWLAAYENYNSLQPYGAAINGQAYNKFTALNQLAYGAKNYTSWDSQMVKFSVVNYGPGDSDTLTSYTANNQVIYFALPFTFGTAFEAGFYANASAGERASGGDTTQNQTVIDFFHTMTWGGPGYVLDTGGNTVNGFSVASSSGFNYMVAAVPAPATLWLYFIALPGWFASVRRNAVRRNPGAQ
jgi:hypothetical protein